MILSSATGGVLTSIVISILDNIYKNFAVAVAVYISAFVSVALLGVQLEAKFFVGSTVVACSVLLYNDEVVARDRASATPAKSPRSNLPR